MGTQLATVAPLPIPAPLTPLPELPGWASDMVKNLGRFQFDPTINAYRECPTLVNLPTTEHRRELESHRGQLIRLLEQKPVADRQYAKQTFGLIAKLILAKPARNGSPEATEARVEAYEMALDDVPWWAVAIAIRKWHRGDWGNGFDYRWAPESADLRRLALREAQKLSQRIIDVDQVLKAVPHIAPSLPPRPSISPEQCALNRAALREAGLGFAVDSD